MYCKNCCNYKKDCKCGNFEPERARFTREDWWVVGMRRSMRNRREIARAYKRVTTVMITPQDFTLYNVQIQREGVNTWHMFQHLGAHIAYVGKFSTCWAYMQGDMLVIDAGY